jgi:hypothetical protein
VPQEKHEFELRRLRVEQSKTREDEIFGGLTLAERAAFDTKTTRINDLEIEQADVAYTKRTEQRAKAKETAQ